MGCENLPVTAVLHYTDALPPHELPVVVTGLSEDQLSMTGTEGSMRRAHATQDPDLPAVVVTGSIAEMIGGGVTPEGSNLLRFIPRTIDEDQWQSADRAIYWLWTRIRREEDEDRSRAPRAPSRGSTSSGRSTAPSTCRRTWPRFAAWSKALAARSTWCSRSARMSRICGRLADADVNICMYREFGRLLCEELGKPYLQAPIGMFATTNFLRTLGELAGLDPEPFIAAGKAHDDQADLGSVAQRDAGFLRHGVVRASWRRNLRVRRAPVPGR